MNILVNLYQSIKDKHIYSYVFCLLLALPNFVWIILDKGLWWGDPAGYAYHSIMLYKNLVSDLFAWTGMMFNGYKAPLLQWISQFLVPLGNSIGSISFSLLLLPVLSSFVALIFIFKGFEQFFKNKTIAICGSLIVAASPLFNGLSTGFWIEPMQVAITSWFLYAMIKVNSRGFYFVISQLVIAVSLAMLIKVSSPLYIIGPCIAIFSIALAKNPSFKVSKRDVLYLSVALLFLLPTIIFYVHNIKDLFGFAQFASSTDLFGTEVTKFNSWIYFLMEGIFVEFTFNTVFVLMVLSIIKIVRSKAYRFFTVFLFVALFQIVIFFVVWLQSPNSDPRYFLPILPYFAFIVCWALSVLKNSTVTMIAIAIFSIQLFIVNGFAYGFVNLNPPYGLIRPLVTEPENKLSVINDLMPLVTRDSAVMFDLLPEISALEFQFEHAKADLYGNWHKGSIDVGAFYYGQLQKVDTANSHIDTVWRKILEYNPDYYVTWKSRLSPALAKAEMRKISKYYGVTAQSRWAIAERVKNSGLYKSVELKKHPDLLIYKRQHQNTNH